MNWLGFRATLYKSTALGKSTALALALVSASAAMAQNAPPAADAGDITPSVSPSDPAAQAVAPAAQIVAPAAPPLALPSLRGSTPETPAAAASPSPASSPSAATTPSPEFAQAATPAPSATAAPASPAEAQASDAPPIKTVAQKYDAAIGPQKPEINQAIREALLHEQTSLTLTAQRRAILRAVENFYAERGDAPLWRQDDHWSAEAQSVFAEIQRAGDDGLDLSAYRVFELGAGKPKGVAAADVALSDAVAAYAFQASGGRVETQKISKLIDVQPPLVGAAQALEESSAAPDAGATLSGYNPAFPGYQALKQKLASLRANDESRAPDAASRRPTELERALLVNMEFWRWLPRDLGKDRVVVNIPEFTGRLYRDNLEQLDFRVITGKPDKATPLFSNKMAYIVVNPSWNVPQSIIRNEFMPKLAALRAQGYEITTVNGQLHVRQPPGERNALGQVKFVFPNNYAVYMHDTPTRKLFGENYRAFSHGCVRVDQPFKLAEAILGPARYSEERLRKMVGKTERRINLTETLPVHFVYFTVTDEDGLRRFDDIYGYAGKTAEALGLESAPEPVARVSARHGARASARLGARVPPRAPVDGVEGVDDGPTGALFSDTREN